MADDQSWLTFDYYPAGTDLIEQGGTGGTLFVLKSGEVEVKRDGRFVASIRQPGAIFGEMSVLLGQPHSATVTTVSDVQVFVISDALAVLEAHPSWLMQIARLLAQRVNATTAQLVKLREQVAGEDEVMVLPGNLFQSWTDPQI